MDFALSVITYIFIQFRAHSITRRAPIVSHHVAIEREATLTRNRALSSEEICRDEHAAHGRLSYVMPATISERFTRVRRPVIHLL